MNLHIGIDFDNTIVNYGAILHKYALERRLISPGVAKDKEAIKAQILQAPKGQVAWRELQATVYGDRLAEAAPSPDVQDFFAFCQNRGIEVSIISHKTQFPEHGVKVDLRKAAEKWLKKNQFFQLGLRKDHYVFVDTLRAKLAEISKRNCTHFIDDLVHVLKQKKFPHGVMKILYTDNNVGVLPKGVIHFYTWKEITHFLLDQECTV